MAHAPVVRIKSAAQVALDLVQREFPNYHPLVSLARLAHSPTVLEDPKLELQVHATILPYVAPKLQSVEVVENNPDDRRVVVTLFDEAEITDAQEVRHVPVETSIVLDDRHVELIPLDA